MHIEKIAPALAFGAELRKAQEAKGVATSNAPPEKPAEAAKPSGMAELQRDAFEDGAQSLQDRLGPPDKRLDQCAAQAGPLGGLLGQPKNLALNPPDKEGTLKNHSLNNGEAQPFQEGLKRTADQLSSRGSAANSGGPADFLEGTIFEDASASDPPTGGPTPGAFPPNPRGNIDANHVGPRGARSQTSSTNPAADALAVGDRVVGALTGLAGAIGAATGSAAAGGVGAALAGGWSVGRLILAVCPEAGTALGDAVYDATHGASQGTSGSGDAGSSSGATDASSPSAGTSGSGSSNSSAGTSGSGSTGSTSGTSTSGSSGSSTGTSGSGSTGSTSGTSTGSSSSSSSGTSGSSGTGSSSNAGDASTPSAGTSGTDEKKCQDPDSAGAEKIAFDPVLDAGAISDAPGASPAVPPEFFSRRDLNPWARIRINPTRSENAEIQNATDEQSVSPNRGLAVGLDHVTNPARPESPTGGSAGQVRSNHGLAVNPDHLPDPAKPGPIGG